MRFILILLFFNLKIFSQTKNKPDVKAIEKNKIELKNSVKSVIIEDKKSILNDTTIRVSKKSFSQVPLKEKNLSYKIGFELLNSCNTSKIRKFTKEEVSASLLKKINLDYISAICINNNESYGKFKDIELKEVLFVENTETTIYRFKALYVRTVLTKELRIYINKQGLVSVIKTLRWKDKFELKKKFKPRKKKIIDSLTIIDESLIIRD